MRRSRSAVAAIAGQRAGRAMLATRLALLDLSAGHRLVRHRHQPNSSRSRRRFSAVGAIGLSTGTSYDGADSDDAGGELIDTLRSLSEDRNSRGIDQVQGGAHCGMRFVARNSSKSPLSAISQWQGAQPHSRCRLAEGGVYCVFLVLVPRTSAAVAALLVDLDRRLDHAHRMLSILDISDTSYDI